MDTKKFRQKILDLAIRGKLVPQDPNDEPASVLLERIRAEKEQLIKEGKIKRSKKSAATDKSHYENVPFEIPKNWVWCKLDDLAFYKKGPFGSSLTKSMFIPDNGDAYKVYEQKNAIQKDSNLGHYFISGEKFQELKGFEVLPNDIIVSCAGTIGETYIMPSDIRSGIINQALMIIRLHNIDITPFYLLYFDFILKNEAGKDGKGSAIKNIPPFDILKNYWIPLPPLAEQDRIIKEVALWQCLIDSIGGNIEDIFKLSKKTKSKILDLAISGKLVPQDPNDKPAIELLKRTNPDFQPCDNSHYGNLPFEVPDGWCWAKINDVTEFIKNGAQIKQFKGASGIPITRIETISNSELDMARMGYANITNGAEYKDYYIKDGDILMSHINSRAHIGKCALCNVGENQIIHGMNLLRIRCGKQILPEYMVHYFRSTTFYNLIEPHIKNAVNQASINITNLQKILIPIPPYSEQKRVALMVDKLFSTIDTITAEL